MDVVEFQKQPVMGIVRGLGLDQVEPLIEAVISSGLKTIEITMNTKGAVELIRRAKKAARGRLCLGAGTVLEAESLKQALKNGATFAVTPVLVSDVVKYCVKNKIPVFPGALTPTEIHQAWQEGATMVKVFPAKCFGPEYLKEIKGPFDGIKLMAVAGVTPENTREYFVNGASAIAFGSSVFKKEWLRNKKYGRIISVIKGYLAQLP